MDSSDALIARFLALHPRSIDLSLERIAGLLDDLGHPERRLPPVIHVAGTNGKGSTIAFMRAILEGAGYAAHVYTSPHLMRFHERIRLGQVGGGRFVDEERLVEVLRRCEDANAGRPITMFEITTAAAFPPVAKETAGITRPGCPAVIAPQVYLEAAAPLRDRAERLGAEPILI